MSENHYHVLDKGFVRLVDVMGNDSAIVQAARVSYGDGTKTKRQDRGLIRYLMRNKHTSPFEMCELKFHIKCPIFVARQWLRHRTANVNEYSGRYSVIKDEFYIPEEQDLKKQNKTNKQGSSEEQCEDADIAKKIIISSGYLTYKTYDVLLYTSELSREQARIVLPLNTYTEFYWKIDLHNLLHFISLRHDSHAQKEIQEYASVLLEIVSNKFPITYEAFKDYVLNSVTLTKDQLRVLKFMWSCASQEEDIKLTKEELKAVKDLVDVI